MNEDPVDENKEEQPLSSEELLRRAREGLGDTESSNQPPADFQIESYSAPTVEPSFSPVYSDDSSPTDSSNDDYVDEPVAATPEQPKWSTPEPTTPKEQAPPWSPPPTDSGGGDWTTPAPQPQTPAPAPRRSGIGSRVGIFIGLIALLGFGVFSFLDSSKTVDEIEAGDCMNWPEDVFYEIEPIDCAEPHDVEVFSNVDLGIALTSTAYPGEDAVYDAAYEACAARFETYVGVPYDDFGVPYANNLLFIDAFTPTLEGWVEVDDRIANCVVFAVDSDDFSFLQLDRSLSSALR